MDKKPVENNIPPLYLYIYSKRPFIETKKYIFRKGFEDLKKLCTHPFVLKKYIFRNAFIKMKKLCTTPKKASKSNLFKVTPPITYKTYIINMLYSSSTI